MVGDVNIYANDPDDPRTAEIEIMIAEPERWAPSLPPSLPFMIGQSTELSSVFCSSFFAIFFFFRLLGHLPLQNLQICILL